jgi:hypothetical protein
MLAEYKPTLAHGSSAGLAHNPAVRDRQLNQQPAFDSFGLRAR